MDEGGDDYLSTRPTDPAGLSVLALALAPATLTSARGLRPTLVAVAPEQTHGQRRGVLTLKGNGG